MYLNTLDVKLTPRKSEDSYNLEINDSTLETLGLILEFKVATGWHIARFLTGRDYSRYIYTKLRRMWQAGLLESFKVYSGSLAGIPVFYMLSKQGLKVLEENGKYEREELNTYPQAKQLLSWGLFKHESQIVELASLEIKNKSENFNIKVKGETSSLSREFLSNKNVETLTPDYIVNYQIGESEQCIYSEFERTAKSKEAMLRKIKRYINFLSLEERNNKTLRIIFQTPSMEKSFWMNIISNGAGFLQKLRILTTNLSLIDDYSQFLEPIYLSENSIKLVKNGSLKIGASDRIKLFSFL